MFNQLALFSENSNPSESLVHSDPGLTRDCREVRVKGVLPIPINFYDTPGIDFFVDRIKIRDLPLKTFGNLFSYNVFPDEDTIEEFAKFIQEGNVRDSKKRFDSWHREFLKLLEKYKNMGHKQGGVLEHLLSPEKSITEFLYPLMFDEEGKQEKELSKFALGKIIELASDSVEKADAIFFLIDSKKDLDNWDLMVGDWIKFLLARQEITNFFDAKNISQRYF